jgi:precorrin-3B methylase
MESHTKLLVEKLKHEKKHYEQLKHVVEDLMKHLEIVAKKIKETPDVEKQAIIYEEWRKARKETFKRIKETLAQIEIHF